MIIRSGSVITNVIPLGNSVLNPKKWNILCWAALLLWSYPSVAGNVPMEPDKFEPHPIEMPDGTTAMAYGQTYLIGWPFTYLEISSPTNNAPQKTYNVLMFCLNVVLVLTTLFGVIYSIQILIPKFSIKTLLIAISGIALLFPLGHYIFSTDNYFLQSGFIYSIYFAPVVTIFPAFVCSKLQKPNVIRGITSE